MKDYTNYTIALMRMFASGLITREHFNRSMKAARGMFDYSKQFRGQA